MVLRFFILAVFLFMSCAEDERNNSDDEDSKNYVSSSSVSKKSSSSVQVVPVSCDMNYGTVTIGSQVWMAENLNCNVSGSKCYDNSEANCAKYGRLYNWATAMKLPGCNSKSCASQVGANHQGICPSGWHIPSDAEWTTLTDYVGGDSTAGKYLKATSGWNSGGNGQDTYGFAALSGGLGSSDGSFYDVGINGLWWSASESNAHDAYYRLMGYNYENVLRYSYGKSDLLFSVRCLQD